MVCGQVVTKIHLPAERTWDARKYLALPNRMAATEGISMPYLEPPCSFPSLVPLTRATMKNDYRVKGGLGRRGVDACASWEMKLSSCGTALPAEVGCIHGNAQQSRAACLINGRLG